MMMMMIKCVRVLFGDSIKIVNFQTASQHPPPGHFEEDVGEDVDRGEDVGLGDGEGVGMDVIQ